MAHYITPIDASAIMNSLAKQTLGKDALTAIDFSDFVSVGEAVASVGKENVINSLIREFTRVINASRPYKRKLMMIENVGTNGYSERLLKNSFYSKDAKEVFWVNTNLNTEIMTGNSLTIGDIDLPVVAQFHFGGQHPYDFTMTFPEEQLKCAFEGEAQFADFWNKYFTEFQNQIETYRENENRTAILNQIAGRIDLQAILTTKTLARNLTSEFNAFYGTSYTTAQLLSTYYKEFLAFFIATLKKDQNRLTERNCNHAFTPVKNVTENVNGTPTTVSYTTIYRHTPIEDQRLILNDEVVKDAESLVLPEIFHDELLRVSNYEGVGYWQSNRDGERQGIKIEKPAIPDTTKDADTMVQIDGADVDVEVVLGLLFDKDACMTQTEVTAVDVSPLDPKHRLRTSYSHYMFNSINDFTEQGIVYYMAD